MVREAAISAGTAVVENQAGKACGLERSWWEIGIRATVAEAHLASAAINSYADFTEISSVVIYQLIARVRED